MDYTKLTADTWGCLERGGSLVSGYKSTWLSLSDNEVSDLHIFKDESGHNHLAIKVQDKRGITLEDPGVNGLQVLIAQYRFGDGQVSPFIDIRCGIESYVQEFTEVVREIAKAILVDKEKPEEAARHTINNWVSFWAKQEKSILSEEGQIGLICELLFLEKLCILNPSKGLNTWTGPLGEKHDFNFTDWDFEVKGTRKKSRIHTVNGIEQLHPNYNKKLGFVSFEVSSSRVEKENTLNLPGLIGKIRRNYFKKKPDLLVRFNELLARNGYSPIFRNEYIKFNLRVNTATFYEVDEDFPKLTSSMLNEPLGSRVSSVKYDISLEGLKGEELEKVNIGEFFY